MKVASLFDLVADSKNILDFFERVETAEQLISRLERLKRQGTTELLDSLAELRTSIDNVLMDTLEMSALADGNDFMEGDETDQEDEISDELFASEKDDLDSDLTPEDLADLGISDEEENENPPEDPGSPEVKNEK